jgi:hypothetical protein
MIVLVIVALVALFAIVLLAKTVKIVPQARAGIVERFGKYQQTLDAGLKLIVPFIDRVRYLIDLREQVVSFPPQPSSPRTTWWSRSTPSSTSRSPTRLRRPTRSPTTSRPSSS